MPGYKEFKLMKQRILYIDRIKGLAIILVVVGHLYTFSEATDGNLVNKLIGSFHMALFMFVSGFVAYILPPHWTIGACSRNY